MVDGCLDIYRGYFGPANKFGDYEVTHCGKPDLDKPGQHYDIHLISVEWASRLWWAAWPIIENSFMGFNQDIN